MKNLTVQRIVAVMEAAGIDQAARERFHRQFEQSDPEGHALFLAALSLDAVQIEELRARFRQSA